MSNFPSCHETYLEAYEQGWWQCIKNYAADIDYASTERDTWAVKYGGQITWRAYAKGHVDAEARIKENIRLFGKENMQQELQWLLDPT